MALQKLRRARRARPLIECLEDRTVPTLLGVPTWDAQGPNPILNFGSGALPDSAVGAIATVAVAHVPVSTANPGGYILYAGTVNGGVWRANNVTDSMFQLTTDSSGNLQNDPSLGQLPWTPLTDQQPAVSQPSLAISALAVDPNDRNGQTVWAGTGTLSSLVGTGGPAIGLLKTTDGGQTWINLGNSQLAGSPVLSIVLAAGGDDWRIPQIPLVASFGHGVLYSFNGGQSFQNGRVVDQNGNPVVDSGGNPVVPTGNASDLVADPNNSDRYYAAVVGNANTAADGVFRSDDSGVDWTKIDTDGRFSTLPFGGVPSWIRLAVNNDNGSSVLYGAEADSSSNQNLLAVFRATIASDGTATWAPESGTTPADTVPGIVVPTPFWHFGLVADPVNANLVYLSGYEGNVWRADFSGVAPGSYTGAHWASLDTDAVGSPHDDSRHLAFLNNTTLLETDDGGIYGLNHPQNPGATDHWVSLNNSIADTEVGSAAYDETTGHVTVGAWDNGTSSQTASGWQSLPDGGGDGGLVAVSTTGVHYYFNDRAFDRDDAPAAHGDRVWLAGAATPSVQGSGLNSADRQDVYAPGTYGSNGNYPFVLSPTSPTRILIGRTGVYESTNERDVVADVTPGTGDFLGTNPATGSSGAVTALAYGTDNANAAYVAALEQDNQSQAVTGRQLWVRGTTGGGSAWHQVNLPSAWISTDYAAQIVVAPDNYQHIFVLDAARHVWEATNAANNSLIRWTDITENLASQQVNTIEFYDPTPSGQPGDGVLLAGTLNGVFRRFGPEPGGTTWRPFGTLPNAQVFSLRYYGPSQSNSMYGDVLVAGLWGRGAWTVAQAGSVINTPATLQVNADGVVRGGNTVDLRIDPNRAGFLQVLVNGQVQFDQPYAFLSRVEITATGSQDAVQIENVPQSISVTATSGDQGTVTVGHNHSLQGILGDVTIRSASGQVPGQVTLDAASDGTGGAITLGSDPTFGYLVNGLANTSQGRGRIGLALDPTTPVSIATAARTFHLLGLGGAPALSLHGGGGTLDTGSSGLAGNFDHAVGLDTFSAVSLHVLGDWSGSLLGSTVGTLAAPVDHITIDGSMLANSRLKVNYLGPLTVGGNLDGTVDGYGQVNNAVTQFTVGAVTVGGNFDGSITAPSIKSINMRPASAFAGHAGETEPGADFQSLVLGTVTSTGVISAGAVDNATVAGDMAGQIVVAGSLGSLSVGGNLTGSVSAATIGSISVGQDLSGQVSASQSLGTFAVGGAVTGSISAPVIQQATVNGTVGDDTFVLTPSSVALNGRTILSGSFGALTVHGGNGNDLFQIQGGSVPATITAGSGNDTFQLFTGAGITGSLDGGGGTNTLDYSHFVGDVTVDLSLALATGIAGGLAHVENVTGSQGNDLIVGDGNQNVLRGGSGRNIIISGGGGGRIYGGGGDNLLIGGTTAYDTNLAVLDALMAEWTRTDLGFDQRVNDIRMGRGLLAGTGYHLDRDTVQGDSTPEQIWGGTGQNWFFADGLDTLDGGAGPGDNDRLTRVD
jgi:hypothetical protein